MGRMRPSTSDCRRVGCAGLLAFGAAMLGAPPVTGQADSVPAIVFRTPVSVRHAGLNGAGAALVGDAGAVFSNPAGLATIRHIALEGAFRTAPSDAFVVAGAMAWRLRQFDLGFGFEYADLGSEPARYGIPLQPDLTAREVLGVGSLVYRFGLLAVGGSAKVLRRTLDTLTQRGFSADAGLAIAFFDILAIGFARQNIGGNWDDPLPDMPSLSRLGFTMNYVDPQESFRLLSVLEVQWPEDQSARLVLGGEAGVVLGSKVGLVGRLAWSSRPTLPSFSAATFGATFALPRINVDYAYRQDDLLREPAHRLGMRLTL
jgi:hypothetical protein